MKETITVNVLDEYRLPVVQLGTELSYLKGVEELGWDGFREREVARMKDENEVLTNNLYYLGRMDSPHEWHHDLAEVTRFLTYGILAHQVELDHASDPGASLERLPVVSSEAIDLFGPGDMSEEEWQLHCGEAFNRLEVRNLRLAKFVGGLLGASGANAIEDKLVARNAMMYTHAFLDLQSLADHSADNSVK